MKVEIIYVYTDREMLARFQASLLDTTIGREFWSRMTITCVNNLGELPQAAWFDKVILHDNSGWDIGAFQAAASRSDADLCIFFGSHVYFHRSGWLERILEVFRYNQRALYGATATGQNEPNIRTTGFWCNPNLFRAIYPELVTHRGHGGDRYAFEHGPDSLTKRWMRAEYPVRLVTWDSIVPPHRGSGKDYELWTAARTWQYGPEQPKLLFCDRHTDLWKSHIRCPVIRGGCLCELTREHSGQHFIGGRLVE